MKGISNARHRHSRKVLIALAAIIAALGLVGFTKTEMRWYADNVQVAQNHIPRILRRVAVKPGAGGKVRTRHDDFEKRRPQSCRRPYHFKRWRRTTPQSQRVAGFSVLALREGLEAASRKALATSWPWLPDHFKGGP